MYNQSLRFVDGDRSGAEVEEEILSFRWQSFTPADFEDVFKLNTSLILS
jgi:hypothetical protein